MKKLIILLGLLSTLAANAQQTEGIVSYKRKTYWTKIISRLTYLSREEKDRAAQTWKNEEEVQCQRNFVYTQQR